MPKKSLKTSSSVKKLVNPGNLSARQLKPASSTKQLLAQFINTSNESIQTSEERLEQEPATDLSSILQKMKIPQSARGQPTFSFKTYRPASAQRVV